MPHLWYLGCPILTTLLLFQMWLFCGVTFIFYWEIFCYLLFYLFANLLGLLRGWLLDEVYSWGSLPYTLCSLYSLNGISILLGVKFQSFLLFLRRNGNLRFLRHMGEGDKRPICMISFLYLILWCASNSYLGGYRLSFICLDTWIGGFFW